MKYGDFKSAIDVVETHLSDKTHHVDSDGDGFYVYVGSRGWPSRIGSEAITALEGAGWEFEGHIDAWRLSL